MQYNLTIMTALAIHLFIQSPHALSLDLRYFSSKRFVVVLHQISIGFNVV